MPIYRVCPDDGCVVGDDPMHQVFHVRLAVPIEQLAALAQQVQQLTAAVAALQPAPTNPTEGGA